MADTWYGISWSDSVGPWASVLYGYYNSTTMTVGAQKARRVVVAGCISPSLLLSLSLYYPLSETDSKSRLFHSSVPRTGHSRKFAPSLTEVDKIRMALERVGLFEFSRRLWGEVPPGDKNQRDMRLSTFRKSKHASEIMRNVSHSDECVKQFFILCILFYVYSGFNLVVILLYQHLCCHLALCALQFNRLMKRNNG